MLPLLLLLQRNLPFLKALPLSLKQETARVTMAEKTKTETDAKVGFTDESVSTKWRVLHARLLEKVNPYLDSLHLQYRRARDIQRAKETDIQTSIGRLRRDTIFKWFSGLSLHSKLAALTISDPHWISLLFAMHARLDRLNEWRSDSSKVLWSSSRYQKAAKAAIAAKYGMEFEIEGSSKNKRGEKMGRSKRKGIGKTLGIKSCTGVQTTSLPHLIRHHQLLQEASQEVVLNYTKDGDSLWNDGDRLYNDAARRVIQATRFFTESSHPVEDGRNGVENLQHFVVMDPTWLRGNFNQFLKDLDVITSGMILLGIDKEGETAPTCAKSTLNETDKERRTAWKTVSWFRQSVRYDLAKFIVNQIEVRILCAWELSLVAKCGNGERNPKSRISSTITERLIASRFARIDHFKLNLTTSQQKEITHSSCVRVITQEIPDFSHKVSGDGVPKILNQLKRICSIFGASQHIDFDIDKTNTIVQKRSRIWKPFRRKPSYVFEALRPGWIAERATSRRSIIMPDVTILAFLPLSWLNTVTERVSRVLFVKLEKELMELCISDLAADAQVPRNLDFQTLSGEKQNPSKKRKKKKKKRKNKKKKKTNEIANVKHFANAECKPVREKLESKGSQVAMGTPLWKWARQVVTDIISESTQLSHRKRSKKKRKMMKELRRFRRKRLVVHELESCSVFSNMYASVWKALGFLSGKLAQNTCKRVRKLKNKDASEGVRAQNDTSSSNVSPHEYQPSQRKPQQVKSQLSVRRGLSAEAAAMMQSESISNLIQIGQNPTIRVSRSGLKSLLSSPAASAAGLEEEDDILLPLSNWPHFAKTGSSHLRDTLSISLGDLGMKFAGVDSLDDKRTETIQNQSATTTRHGYNIMQETQRLPSVVENFSLGKKSKENNNEEEEGKTPPQKLLFAERNYIEKISGLESQINEMAKERESLYNRINQLESLLESMHATNRDVIAEREVYRFELAGYKEAVAALRAAGCVPPRVALPNSPDWGKTKHNEDKTITKWTLADRHRNDKAESLTDAEGLARSPSSQLYSDTLYSEKRPFGNIDIRSQKSSLDLSMSLLDNAIEDFVRRVRLDAERRMTAKMTALRHCKVAVQSIWPRAQVNVYGSFVTELQLPSSDLDVVICLPKVRRVINHQWAIASHAGTLEGTDAIKETWQEQLSRCLLRCPWVLPDTLNMQGKTMPIITLATRPLGGQGITGEAFSVKLDISIQGSSHNGLASNMLIQSLSRQFPALVPLTLVLKQFLKENGFLTAFTGGLSSYGLVMLLTRFLQSRVESEEELHYSDGNARDGLGSLLLSFLDHLGSRFNPRTTGVSVAHCCYTSRMSTSSFTAHQLLPSFIKIEEKAVDTTKRESSIRRDKVNNNADLKKTNSKSKHRNNSLTRSSSSISVSGEETKRNHHKHNSDRTTDSRTKLGMRRSVDDSNDIMLAATSNYILDERQRLRSVSTTSKTKGTVRAYTASLSVTRKYVDFEGQRKQSPMANGVVAWSKRAGSDYHGPVEAYSAGQDFDKSSLQSSNNRSSGVSCTIMNARGRISGVDFVRDSASSRFSAHVGGAAHSNFGRALVDPHKFDPLLIEDPLMRSNNIGRNCFRIYYIQRTCANAHSALIEALHSKCAELIHANAGNREKKKAMDTTKSQHTEESVSQQIEDESEKVRAHGGTNEKEAKNFMKAPCELLSAIMELPEKLIALSRGEPGPALTLSQLRRENNSESHNGCGSSNTKNNKRIFQNSHESGSISAISSLASVAKQNVTGASSFQLGSDIHGGTSIGSSDTEGLTTFNGTVMSSGYGKEGVQSEVGSNLNYDLFADSEDNRSGSDDDGRISLNTLNQSQSEMMSE